MTSRRAWAPALVLGSGLLFVLGIRDPNGQELREPLATLPASMGPFGSEDRVLDAAELAAFAVYLGFLIGLGFAHGTVGPNRFGPAGD